MAREELATARDRLESAADQASDDVADRLVDLAGQLDTLVERDQDPDHGRLARIQNALGDVRDDAGDAVADAIDDAKERIASFRSGIEGV